MSELATAIFIALFTLAAVTGVAITVVRVARGLRQRLRARRAVEPRIALLTLAAGGEEEQERSLRELERIPRSAWRAAEPIAFDLLSKLRGEARVALAESFRRRGLIARAQRDLRAVSPVRRARAASALGTLGEAAVLPELCRLLDDNHPDVRIAAAQAIGRLGEQATGGTRCLLASLERADPTPSQLVAHSLIQIGLPAVPDLKEVLDSGSDLTRATALDALRLLGAAEADPQVIALLEGNPAPEVRYRAAATLGRIGARGAVAPLIAATGPDQPRRLRATAARALGELGDRTAVPALTTLMGGADHRIGGEAAAALLRLGKDGAAALDQAAAGSGDAAAHARQALAIADLARQRAQRRPRQAASGTPARA